MNEMEAKVSYIQNNVMTKYDIRHLLKKFIQKTGLNYWDLKNHKSKTKNYIIEKLRKMLKKMVLEN